MSGRFIYKPFSEIDLDDPFFDSLKADYPGTPNSTEFCEWFKKKALSGSKALVYENDYGIGAFVYIKKESETVELIDAPSMVMAERLKLGTLKISDLNRGQRIGEGAIGLALWNWQRSKVNEIYVTVFPKHEVLIKLLERFGFVHMGTNPNGEKVYCKNRLSLSYENPYVSFPFINPDFKEAGYLIFEDKYHDTMFPYSELKDTTRRNIELSVANGMSKIYVSASQSINHNIGNPILVYRKYNGSDGSKGFKSCITSVCMVTDCFQVKIHGKHLMTFQELLNKIGNKSVFDERELKEKYENDHNVIVYGLLYYAYFGSGNNVNYFWLKNRTLWSKDGGYPTNTKLNRNEFEMILREAKLDVQNIIIN